MKRVYQVFQDEKSGQYYAAYYKTPFCPIFGSFGTKKKAREAAANRMYLSVKDYNQLQKA